MEQTNENNPLDLIEGAGPTFAPHSWEQQEQEEEYWFHMFHEYFLFGGPARSVHGAYRKFVSEYGRRFGGQPEARTNGSLNYWQLKAREYGWEARAQDFDEDTREQTALKWQQRRDEQREREWNASSKLLNEATAYLERMEALREKAQKAPKVKGRVQSPVMKAVDATRFVEVGSKVGRLAAEMATDHTVRVDIKARVEELRRTRWDEVGPNLSRILADPEPNIIEGEVVDKPPVDATSQSVEDAAS